MVSPTKSWDFTNPHNPRNWSNIISHLTHNATQGNTNMTNPGPVAPSTKGPTADGQAVGTAKVKEAGFIREPVASCYLGYSWGETITIVIFMYIYIVINNPQKLGGYNPCNNR
jgi:hypothetical protein